MADTKATPFLDTPAAVAAAVLDAIKNESNAFDMNSWFWNPGGGTLAPGARPDCGTTMCAAGWAAHLTGWTLVCLAEDEQHEVTGRDDDGNDAPTRAQVYARKGNESRLICDVAQDALGLKASETFWYANQQIALKQLSEIAGR